MFVVSLKRSQDKECGFAEESMKKRIVVGITGASGIIYGVQLLKALSTKNYEVHLIISEPGKTNIAIETGYSVEEIERLAHVTHSNHDLAASVASGSYLTEGMIICPCSMKTLSGIANSYNENLVIRSADVALKERRKLVLVTRETPLHLGHLRLMTSVTEMGGVIVPPIPAFYHKPKTIEDLIDQTIGKILDIFHIEHNLFQRWGEG
jgi:4-hydroxy-3-polyprenylbenzoate decarboxylase